MTSTKKTRGKEWSDKEIAHLKELWRSKTVHECSEILGRATSSIYYKVYEQGFKRDPEHESISARSRFKKGHASWNTGLKGWDSGGNSHKTRFKRGHGNSNNEHPVGYEKLDKDGVLLRKVSKTGARNEKWRPVKDIVYEEHNGQIPEGCIINFNDGNKENYDPSNLIALTRAQMLDRNRIQRYGSEVHGIAITLGRFKSKLRKLENEECE
ncbi:MAG TPA: HNH endonuclease signature motif containing protein [Pseudomonadales bacterium]|nr:HNH endonuclease signature motif containing protein [Pseudomonadales bacterium]